MDLFNNLSSERIDFKDTAADWLGKYKENEASATTDLVTLLYCAAGAKPFSSASIKNLSDEELFILKSSIHENCKERISQTVFNNFVNFIDFILFRNAVEFLSNKRFMETIVTNLQFFVESDITQYRLVSIVVGTRLMSAALLIDTNRKEELNSLKKSIKELERNRDLFDEVISKGGELAKQIAERKMKMFQRVKTLQKYNCYRIIFLNLLSSLFENALRSSEAEVRRHCYIAMVSWIKFMEVDFIGKRLSPILLKMMNDPKDDLREVAVQNYLQCLQSNIKLTVDEKDQIKALKALFELVHDCKDEIKVYALKCLNIIERCKLFSLYRVEKIFLLIFHEQREVASEAAHFLHRRICTRVSKKVESEEEEFNDFEMKSQIYITDLISFLQECPDNCSEEFLIDALINKSKFLTNWPAWINLLEEASSIHGELDVELIINLMSCTLKLANTGMLPVGRKAKKGKSTASIISRNIQESSKFFEGNIDKLLEKYASNDRIFYILLRCFRYLSFEEVDEVFALDFALKFNNILSGLDDSRDLAVYNECGVVFAMFCKNSVRKLNCNSDEWESVKNEIEVIYELLENVCYSTIEKMFDETMNKDLKQSIEVAALHSLQDIAESVCWNSLFVDACKIISSRKNRDSKIAELFLIVCFMSIMWISVYFIERNFENGKVEIEMIYEEKLREASQQYFSKIHYISRGRTSTIGSTLKMTARNIMRLLKKLSVFIEKNNGLPFLMYSMHFE